MTVSASSASNIERLVAELDDASRLLRQVRRAAARDVHPQLEAGQLIMLSRLAGNGPMRISDLAAAVGIDKGPVSRGCSALAELKLVKRTADKADARAAVLTATAAGRRLAGKFDAALAERFTAVSANQALTTARSLRKVLDVLDGR